jgi:hypothetical protein
MGNASTSRGLLSGLLRPGILRREFFISFFVQFGNNIYCTATVTHSLHGASSIRSAMVFVSMDDKNLISRTNYVVRYDEVDEQYSEDEFDYPDHGRRRPQGGDSSNASLDEEDADEDPDSRPLIELATHPGVFFHSRTVVRAGCSRIEASRDGSFNTRETALLGPHATFSPKDWNNGCVITFESAM